MPPLSLVIPANPGERQRLIFVLMEKFKSLLDADDELLLRRPQPGVDIGAIDRCLGRSKLERNACRARIDQLRASDPYKFPDEQTLDKLETALRALRDAIAGSAALSALIEATDGVVETLGAASTEG